MSNFGSATGRKALRQMKLAEKFGRPVVCLVDTAGAYPDRAPRSAARAAIAENLMTLMTLKRRSYRCSSAGGRRSALPSR